MSNKTLLAITIALILFSCAFTFAGNYTATEISIDGKDVVKIMGDIYIPEDKVINGDVVAVMGDITLNGRVKGDVVAVLGDIELNNVVEGDAVCVLGSIQKGPEGKILGEIVEAKSPGNIRLPDGRSFSYAWRGYGWSFKFLGLLTLLGAASLVLALMPDKIKSMTVSLGEDAGRKLFIGFIAVIVIPFIVLLTAVTIIGIPLVPFVILAVVISKFIGYVPIALFIGNRVKNAAKANINIFFELFIGVIILWLVRLIPIIGFISYLVVTVLALGLVLDTKFGTNQPWFRKRDYAPIDASKPEDEDDDPGKT